MAVVRNGGDVILDFGFWTRQSRQEMVETLKRENIAFEWVRMETPIKECRTRNRQRHETGSGLLAITDATFDTLLPRFEPFNDDEIRRMRISNPS